MQNMRLVKYILGWSMSLILWTNCVSQAKRPNILRCLRCENFCFLLWLQTVYSGLFWPCVRQKKPFHNICYGFGKFSWAFKSISWHFQDQVVSLRKYSAASDKNNNFLQPCSTRRCGCLLYQSGCVVLFHSLLKPCFCLCMVSLQSFKRQSDLLTCYGICMVREVTG